MKLDEILQGDQALIYMERFVDEGTRNYSRFAATSEVSPRYQPRSGHPSFALITVLAPRSQVSVFQASPETALLDFYLQPQGVRFLVHPETWSSPEVDHLDALRCLPRGESLHVTPTASTRTVLTMDASAPAHYVKLHCPKRISRFNRRFRLKNIRNSVAVTADLANVHCERFAYLADSLGLTYGHGPKRWGFLVREKSPRPVRQGRFLIPYFALYGGDLHRPDDPPLLVQLIERLGAEPQSFIVDEIIVPVLECWAQIVRERGILLESHAQNLILEIDRDFRPTRVVHRDFDVWVDGEIRRQASLSDLDAEIGTHAPFPREQHYSLVYDHFIGRELFDYLLESLTGFFSIEKTVIQERISAVFCRCFPEADALFPAGTTFYFSNELLPGNDFQLVDTKQRPVWR